MDSHSGEIVFSMEILELIILEVIQTLCYSFYIFMVPS